MGLGSNIISGLYAEMQAAGGTEKDIHLLSTDEGRPILRATIRLAVAARNEKNRIVDLDADPFCPNGWTVAHHQKGGEITFDRNAIGPYLADGQKNGGCMFGNDLREALSGQLVENANQLDWYLAHPDQIPEEWKKERGIFFWGTIYLRADGKLYVRCLAWFGDGWFWRGRCLDHTFGSDVPAAVRKQICP